MTTVQEKIAIIGAGNLGIAIAKGMVESQQFAAEDIIATRRNLSALDELRDLGISLTSDNREAATKAQMIILAVQPRQLFPILEEISDVLDANQHTLVSVIAGISISQVREKLTTNIPIVRAMPNTAIAIKQSMTCIAHSEDAKDQALRVQEVFNTLGKTLIIQEELMAAATVLGACGIAFFMRFIRAASQGGIEVGFHAEEAQLIAAQTAKGAASLLLEHNTHPEHEIDKVTTPQGCTIAGLNEMEHHGLSSALIRGITASHRKIDKMTK